MSSCLQKVFFALAIFIFSTSTAFAQTQAIPKANTVTMVDIGADSCIPCKMMAPILAKLKVEYAAKAEIVFIDVWKNPEEGNKFGIKLIPTQIFYNKKGEETYRHEGFMAEEAIREQLDVLLAQ